MKYKVGDKVKVRSDLNYEKYSEGVPFTSEMDKFKGTVLEVRKIAGEFYEMVGIPYIFTDEMLEPVEEMSAEEAIRLQGEICMSLMCGECPQCKRRFTTTHKPGVLDGTDIYYCTKCGKAFDWRD